MRFMFNIILEGEGNNKQQAWDKAVEAFVSDPGDFDEEQVIYVEEEEL